jgi:[ribosomal protein S18]-alanine N-acetyltransferase
LSDLRNTGRDEFFAPHPIDEQSIHHIIEKTQEDIYLLVYYKQNIVGYGMLRGWDEGFTIPSLGIAISERFKGFGIGRLFMNWLHLHASLSGAPSVRLRVHHQNLSAIHLYKSLNYKLKEDATKPGYLLGELIFAPI